MRERNSYNHLGAFYVTCFARVCKIFTAVVNESQRGPHIYTTTHTIWVQCVCFFF